MRIIVAVTLAVFPRVASSQPSQPALPPVLPAAEEIALAESAAPASISGLATVYVLERGGFVLKRQGSNGFTCLVERSHPAAIEPICYDAEGTAAVLPRVLDEAALREAGLDSAAVASAIADGYRSGRYRVPGAGIAYMLSPFTRFFNPLTGTVEDGHPHVMFYAPYLRNADIGSPGEGGPGDGSLPFVIQEGTPEAWLVVPVERAGARGEGHE